MSATLNAEKFSRYFGMQPTKLNIKFSLAFLSAFSLVWIVAPSHLPLSPFQTPYRQLSNDPHPWFDVSSTRVLTGGHCGDDQVEQHCSQRQSRPNMH